MINKPYVCVFFTVWSRVKTIVYRELFFYVCDTFYL